MSLYPSIFFASKYWYKSKYSFLLINNLQSYSDYYRNKTYNSIVEYDRIYVTTLFTFYWDITIKTILFAKTLSNDVRVGGVMASIIPKEIEDATGIKPFVGLLDKPKLLDQNNEIVIVEKL